MLNFTLIYPVQGGTKLKELYAFGLLIFLPRIYSWTWKQQSSRQWALRFHLWIFLLLSTAVHFHQLNAWPRLCYRLLMTINNGYPAFSRIEHFSEHTSLLRIFMLHFIPMESVHLKGTPLVHRKATSHYSATTLQCYFVLRHTTSLLDVRPLNSTEMVEIQHID